MRKLSIWIVFISFLGSYSLLSAQNVVARLDLGKKDPKPDFYEYSPLDKGMVTLGPSSNASSRYLSITKYSGDLEKQWSEKFMEQNGRKNVDFVSVIGANILVFVSEFFPKENVIKTYYYQYSLDGDPITEEEILSVYPNQKEQKVELQYVHSPNKRRLLCYKNLENKKDSETILYYVFDDAGDFVVNGEINLKYPDNRLRVRSVKVSNQGNVYVLGKFYRVNNIKDADDFKYIINRHDSQTQQDMEIPIELGDKYITDLAFRLDRDENIYVSGFYSNKSTDRIVGTVLQKIGANGDILMNSSQRFDEKFLSNYLSSSQINRGKELRNFYLKDIILRSDGGVLLLAEKFYITYQSYRDMYGYWVDREIFHYEDVMLTSVDGSGGIEWHAIIDKNQVSESPANLSYFNAVGGQGAYIFYEYKPRKKNVNIYYNLVSIEGDVNARQPLLRDYRYGNEFYPKFCEQINNREAIMVYFQNRGRMLSVIKVKFES
ncbi:MAG: hypothetical protein AAF824_03680 [Bacteroidota bacterium]